MLKDIAHPAIPSSKEKITERLSDWITLHQTKLLGLAFSIVGDIHLAQDCVQEAFIQAGLKAHQLKDLDKVYSWLVVITVNECKRQTRSRWLKRVIKGNVPEKVHLDETSGEFSNVHRAVMKLSKRLRIAITLHYYQDLPIQQVSEIMQIQPGTCKAMLHQARKKLSHIMKEEIE